MLGGQRLLQRLDGVTALGQSASRCCDPGAHGWPAAGRTRRSAPAPARSSRPLVQLLLAPLEAARAAARRRGTAYGVAGVDGSAPAPARRRPGTSCARCIAATGSRPACSPGTAGSWRRRPRRAARSSVEGRGRDRDVGSQAPRARAGSSSRERGVHRAPGEQRGGDTDPQPTGDQGAARERASHRVRVDHPSILGARRPLRTQPERAPPGVRVRSPQQHSREVSGHEHVRHQGSPR